MMKNNPSPTTMKHLFKTFEGICSKCGVNRSNKELPCQPSEEKEQSNMTVDEILKEYSHVEGLDLDQAKSHLKQLLLERMPKKKKITQEMENELGEDYPHHEHGFNQAIDEVKQVIESAFRKEV